MLEEKQHQTEALNQEVEKHLASSKQYEQQLGGLLKEAEDKQHVIDERDEEVYTLNEQVEKQVRNSENNTGSFAQFL